MRRNSCYNALFTVARQRIPAEQKQKTEWTPSIRVVGLFVDSPYYTPAHENTGQGAPRCSNSPRISSHHELMRPDHSTISRQEHDIAEPVGLPLALRSGNGTRRCAPISAASAAQKSISQSWRVCLLPCSPGMALADVPRSRHRWPPRNDIAELAGLPLALRSGNGACWCAQISAPWVARKTTPQNWRVCLLPCTPGMALADVPRSRPRRQPGKQHRRTGGSASCPAFRERRLLVCPDLGPVGRPENDTAELAGLPLALHSGCGARRCAQISAPSAARKTTSQNWRVCLLPCIPRMAPASVPRSRPRRPPGKRHLRTGGSASCPALRVWRSPMCPDLGPVGSPENNIAELAGLPLALHSGKGACWCAQISAPWAARKTTPQNWRVCLLPCTPGMALADVPRSRPRRQPGKQHRRTGGSASCPAFREWRLLVCPDLGPVGRPENDT
ncbi:uncharacterized protein LOC142588164 [Dermacentor variabilis]|uniref:uncharacterized protein LOC142588164 n=1 Tax=Dermacentor variabilis TaxID=34621 RepID=UPI003F5C2D1A